VLQKAQEAISSDMDLNRAKTGALAVVLISANNLSTASSCFVPLSVSSPPNQGKTRQVLGADCFSGASLLLESSRDYHDGNGDDMDDEEGAIAAYGSRSLHWTNKYRKLFPYDRSRQIAVNLGLRSKEEWEEYMQDGGDNHGPYLPSRPEEMYLDEWVSWEEFLGVMRPCDETRDIVQSVLQLNSMSEYRAFVLADSQRAAGLRIPARPDLLYRDKGWQDDEHFFGSRSGSS
jgi:hypothetical protein